MCALSEKPAVRSSFFQQMMQDAAHSMHAVSSNVTSTQGSSNSQDSVDITTANTTCEQHSSTCDAASASSTEHPVDSTKTTQQLIG